MNRKQLAEALLNTPTFVDGTSHPPEIYAVNERGRIEFWVKDLRYNEEKGIIELVMEP